MNDTVVGNQAGTSVAAGGGLTAVGYRAARLNTGVSNSVFGGTALPLAGVGGSNVIFGSSAGPTLTDGNRNVLIGRLASTPLATTNNSVAIGDSQFSAGDDTVVIGNSTSPCFVLRPGIPVNASYPNGSYYFRTDGTAGNHIYFASGGTWTALT